LSIGVAVVMKWGLVRDFTGIERRFALALLLPCLAGCLCAQSQPSSTPALPAQNLPDAPVPQQQAVTAPNAGIISGTVVDKDEAMVSGAKITLTVQRPNGAAEKREAISDKDGSFVFTDVTPGPFELAVSAAGFATWKTSGFVQPGQTYLVPRVELVVTANVNVQVTETQEEVAEEEIHVEETQRVFGILPNYYVSYVPNAAPMNTRQKFQLAWKANVNPYSVGIAAFIAGLEQADNAFSGYGPGAQGYAKRFGSTYADGFIGTFIGGAILPSLLKQDPRYFYKGTGTRRSRFLYAVAMAVVCKGDNGRWQPNYSSMLGALAAGGISNLYYPASSRNGVGLTFENTAIGIGGTALGGVVQEFFLRRLTPHASERSRENLPSSLQTSSR
jgi:hypothetical protein